MLYLISWRIKSENRVACWNAFGNMTPADDLKDTGDSITMVGRWHKLGGSGGICVCECTDHDALNSWMLNWSPICEIGVEPIVNDASARAAIQTKPYFQAKSAAESSDEGAEKEPAA